MRCPSTETIFYAGNRMKNCFDNTWTPSFVILQFIETPSCGTHHLASRTSGSSESINLAHRLATQRWKT